jgi:peroxiredoxin
LSEIFPQLESNYLLMKAFLFLVFCFVSSDALSQGCFGKCLDHLSEPLKGQQDVAARIERSETILKGLVGCEAPNFEVTTITGEQLTLSQLKGKVIVMNFWFESCAPCIAELPALNKLANEYQSEEVVFIAFGKDPELRISKFLEQHKFNYKIVSGKYDLVNDYCVIAGWPMNMVIDKNGIVQYIKPGGYTDERAKSAAYNMMKPMIDQALRQ